MICPRCGSSNVQSAQKMSQEVFDAYNDMDQKLGTTSDAIETAATEAMISAIRGFKLETIDAQYVQYVVDVYSALAAKSVVDTEQLAVAISKTASIAKSGGMENVKVNNHNRCLWFILFGWWVAMIKHEQKKIEANAVVYVCQHCGNRWETK